MKEKHLVNWTISYICMLGHIAWRNNAGKLPITGTTGKVRYINVGMKGLPDVIGYTKEGRFIGIECKIKPNKVSPIQQEQLDRMRDAGCLVGVAYTTEDVEELFK